jgi:DGQHR domain-containing protein
MKAKEIIIKALDISHADKKCYITKFKGKLLKKIARVSRADGSSEAGYQRHLDERRSKAIAHYIDNGYLIPGSIILSYKDTPIFNEVTSELTLHLTDTNLLVLDGQHRLFGASLAFNDIDLPVCIICNLSAKEEIQYFLDINSNQKGVSKTLQHELTKYLLEDQSSPEAIRLKLFDLLYEDINSPLLGRMTRTQSVSGKISHVPFEKALNPILTNKTSMLSKITDIDGKYSLIRNYLASFSKLLNDYQNDDKILTTSAYFEAIFKIFDQVCNHSYFYFKNLKEESIYQIIDCLKSLDLDKYSGSNQQTIVKLSSAMSDLIESYMHTKFSKPTEDLF